MARQTIQNANASLYFNGTATKSTVATPATGLSSLVSSLSISGWIYNSSSADYPAIVQLWGGGGNPTGFTLYILFRKTLGFKAKIGGTQYDTQLATLPKDRWVHYSVNFDGTDIYTYINGTLSHTRATVGGSIAITNNEIIIGANNLSNYFRGWMSNLVIAPHMTAQQVQDLYNKGTIPTGATAVYPLSEGAGTVAYDTSGNGNNGTITSGTWTRDTPTKSRKLVNNNLVYNGDFEIAPVVNVAQTTPYRWLDGTSGGTTASGRIPGIYFWDEGGQGSIMLDSTVKKSGNYSLKVSTLATGSFAQSSIGDFNADDYIKLAPSTSYTYSFWMKTDYVSGDATTGARVNFYEISGARATVANNYVGNIKTTTDWTQYTGTFTTAATTRFGVVLPSVMGNNGTATLIMDAWFDDIQLYPTTPVTRNALTFARQPVDELVRNGDFEYAPAFTAATSTQQRWINGTAGGSSATGGEYRWALSYIFGSVGASFDSTVSKTGTYSLKLSQLNTSSDIIASQSRISSTPTIWELNNQLQPALPSTSYTLTAWVKTNNVAANGVFADIREFNGAGAAIVTTPTTKLSGTNDWTQLSLTVTTNSSTRYIGILLRNTVGGNVCDAWFDNISLKLTTPTGRSAA